MSRLEEPGLPYWSPMVEPPVYSGGKRQHFLWDSFPHWNSQFSQTPWCEGKRRPTSSSMRSSRQRWSLLVQLAPQIDVENCWIYLHPMPAISCTCISSKVLNVRIFLNVLFPAWNYGNYVQAIETQASSWSSVRLLQPLSWPGARCQHVFPCVSIFQWSKMLPTLQHEWFSVQSLVTESSWKNLYHGLNFGNCWPLGATMPFCWLTGMLFNCYCRPSFFPGECSRQLNPGPPTVDPYRSRVPPIRWKTDTRKRGEMAWLYVEVL